MDPTWDMDKDDHLWQGHAILNHRGGWKAKVKIMWSDLHTTWEDLNASLLHQPALVAQYAVKQKLLHLPGWLVIKSYLEIDSNMHQRSKLYETSSRHIKIYKFGIQVPQNPREALAIDKQQGKCYGQIP